MAIENRVLIGKLNKRKGDMAQSAVTRLQGEAKPAAYWESIQSRIKAGEAVKVVNKVIQGIECSPMQADMAWKVINKLLPSIQAISVEVSHKQAVSIDDLRNRAEALGVDPATLLTQAIDSTAEKVDVTQDKLDTPLPRDSEA